MADTAVKDAGKKELAPRDVKREFEVFDELPPRPPRPSVLEDALTRVMENAAGKWVCIAKYKNAAAATGAANNLRERHGNEPSIDGWVFRTRKVDEGRTGLFVQYDGSGIVEGKLAAHQANVARKKEEAKARKAQKEASKGK